MLSTLLDSSSKVKSTLKTQSKEFNSASNDHLFGEGFEEKLLKVSKAIQKSQTVFTGLKAASKPSSSGSGAYTKRPFPSGPPFKARGRSQWRNPQFNQNRDKNQYSCITPKGVFRNSNFTSSTECKSSSKEFVSSGTNSRPSCIRRSKILPRKLESVIPRSPIFRMSPGVLNTFSFNALSNKATLVTHLLQGG